MKNFVSALAAAALLVTPMAAVAQGHGGGGFHGAARGGGGFHGGFRGGYRGGYGWRGGYGYGYGFYPFGFGLGFALAADPWFYGFPGYYGYWDGAYGCGPYGCNDYYGSPPPAPPVTGAAPATACGNWVWRTNPDHYQWVPQACAAPAPAGAPPVGS